MDDPEILYPDWQNEYQAALIELDPAKLGKRIEAAEAAIHRRLQQLSQNYDHHAERQVIEDALRSLRFLKKKESGTPWNMLLSNGIPRLENTSAPLAGEPQTRSAMPMRKNEWNNLSARFRPSKRVQSLAWKPSALTESPNDHWSDAYILRWLPRGFRASGSPVQNERLVFGRFVSTDDRLVSDRER
jgi:hypothetical protein